ncbi:MAG: phage tail protein [Pseudomonadota bacterium]
MSLPRVPLYERLPEIHRIRDTEQVPPYPLRAYLASVEGSFSALHENIEALHHDLFIDTCDDWVIPYLADLLGTSHLQGDPRTLRADVADTIALRRRKGTLGAIERLAANLTGWPCRAAELFPGLAWSQHLNHQRPDAAGAPPYGSTALTRFTVPRGGTVPVRDPAMLSLLGGAFDPFAHHPDVKRADDGQVHWNLPNLAVRLWRLVPYRIPVARPLPGLYGEVAGAPAGQAAWLVGFDLDRLGRPVRLFNTYRAPPLSAAGQTQTLTRADAVPGPIPWARLCSDSEAGRPEEYVALDRYQAGAVPADLDLGDTGLAFYLPDMPELDGTWTFRGANLCAWDACLDHPVGDHEILIDPDIGRVIFGLSNEAQALALVPGEGLDEVSNLLVAYTYAAVGPVGAHPQSRPGAPPEFAGQPTEIRPVPSPAWPDLASALADLETSLVPVVVEILDSLDHDLDLGALATGTLTENGRTSLLLNRSLILRAADGQRPLLRLAVPLGFRPVDPAAGSVAELAVRLEGLFLARGPGLGPDQPLIARAALARLEIQGCTLDPGGHVATCGARTASMPALHLANDYGFADPAELDAFAATPDLILQASVTGALFVDDGYRLTLESCIVDAGRNVGDSPEDVHALTAFSDPLNGWGPPLDLRGATLLGRVRVARASGYGGLFCQRLWVWNNQQGCLKYSGFSGDGDRLPPHHACVDFIDARLAFTATWHGQPGYGQLAAGSDFRIRQRGPEDDAMGAFGFLLEAHKWINLTIRLREFMPVGARPLLIAET